MSLLLLAALAFADTGAIPDPVVGDIVVHDTYDITQDECFYSYLDDQAQVGWSCVTPDIITDDYGECLYTCTYVTDFFAHSCESSLRATSMAMWRNW